VKEKEMGAGRKICLCLSGNSKRTGGMALKKLVEAEEMLSEISPDCAIRTKIFFIERLEEEIV
jgi:hypothetical protein